MVVTFFHRFLNYFQSLKVLNSAYSSSERPENILGSCIFINVVLLSTILTKGQ